METLTKYPLPKDFLSCAVEISGASSLLSSSSRKIFEFGPGATPITLRLAPIFPSHDIISTDISPLGITDFDSALTASTNWLFSTSKFRASMPPNYTYLISDAAVIPGHVSPGSVDAVFAIYPDPYVSCTWLPQTLCSLQEQNPDCYMLVLTERKWKDYPGEVLFNQLKNMRGPNRSFTEISLKSAISRYGQTALSKFLEETDYRSTIGSFEINRHLAAQYFQAHASYC